MRGSATRFASNAAKRFPSVLCGPVTTTRSDVNVIVTEFGAAELKGQTLAERSRRLCAIAHPSFREDLERAAEASFAITEVRMGRSSPWAAPLIHMIPQRVMMELVLTGKPISAQRAYEIGLVNRLTKPEALLDTAVGLAQEVRAGAPPSIRAARDMVMLATEMGRSAAMQAARHAFANAYESEDAQEGPRAFAERRRPQWKGR